MLGVPIITNEIYTTLTKVIQHEGDLMILKENQPVPEIPQNYTKTLNHCVLKYLV